MTNSSPSCRRSIPADPQFDALVERARTCRACPSMEGRTRILTHLNGPSNASILLVGEAPGRRGAARTDVPFHGDESGRRLDRLIAAAGWRREDLFITNAVLCNPLDVNGNNRRPDVGELRCCRSFLIDQITIVDPDLVIALGAVALGSLQVIEPHGLRVRDAGGAPIRWFGRWLAVAIHPSARAAIHRPVEQQINDFIRFGRWFASLNGENSAFP